MENELLVVIIIFVMFEEFIIKKDNVSEEVPVIVKFYRQLVHSFMIRIVVVCREFICCGCMVGVLGVLEKGVGNIKLGGYPGARTVSAARS